jgi:hypothetical protein
VISGIQGLTCGGVGAAQGSRGCGAKETWPCPRRDPWPTPATAVRRRSRRRLRRGWGRRHCRRGWLTCRARVAAAESENRKTRGRGRRAADAWGQAAAAAGGARRMSVSGCLGRLAGPRARARAGWVERLGCEAFFSLSSFLFCFSFLFHYLNSNLV